MFRTILCAAGLAALLAPAGLAQSALTVEVPFDFSVGGKMLSAGNYHISLDTLRNTVAIKNEGRGAGAYQMIRNRTSAEEGSSPHVVFNRYGDRYFLAAVEWTARGCQFVESRQEKELRASRPEPRKVVLAAVQPSR